MLNYQNNLAVAQSIVAILAPGPCASVVIQQQATDTQLTPYQLYLVDGVTKSGPVISGGQQGIINAPLGQSFQTGQIIGYMVSTATTGTFTFTITAGEPLQNQLPETIGPNLRQVNVTLTSAQLLALQSTPVQCIPAPPPGYFIDLWGVVLQYKHGSTAYTIGGTSPTFQFEYTGQSTGILNMVPTGLVDQAADTILSNEPAVTLAAFARSVSEALGIEVKLAGTTPSLTLGNGVVIASLTYAVQPLS